MHNIRNNLFLYNSSKCRIVLYTRCIDLALQLNRNCRNRVNGKHAKCN